ncbi:CDP-glycerol glycerophosphotransferase family protein [Aeromicrobium terrae]|uniref:Glycosyl transferase n=1 Tax=Aeromicrobium terrae TaxID=2498846 RepID=A0A5C8NLX0_9ACTN|nr:CDP-glycerol glycerophosphotransferase family protein [Aeromicrobium terrae]TXL61905.1 glycosyl transferase [Aeromicrobium terrae]
MADAVKAVLARIKERFTDRSTPPYSIGLPGMPDGPPEPSRLPAVIRNRRHRRRLRAALREYAPTIGMAYAGRAGAPWQLGMWEPYLLASGEPCVIFHLHEKYLDFVRANSDLKSPIIQLGGHRFGDLRDVLAPSLTSLYYVQNAKNNAGYMRHRHVTHVWLNHGDSDKPANFNPRHAKYDVLVVCGQAGIDRYAKHGITIPREKFEILGRPQASDIEPARGPIASLDQPTVLYAPTWQGVDETVNFSSLERGPEIVQALADRGARVIFRPHPLSYRWAKRRKAIKATHDVLRKHREATGVEHVFGQVADKDWSVADCCNHADALISDVSSVVSDFLQSEKPYAMTTMKTGVDEFRAEYSVAETAYVLLGDLSNLDDVLDDLLKNDPLAEARSEKKRYVLGDFTGHESADAFAAYVRRLAQG